MNEMAPTTTRPNPTDIPPKGRRPRSRQIAGLLIGCAVALGACSTVRTDSTWVDLSVRGQSQRGARVLVVCESADAIARLACEERVAARLSSGGAQPLNGSAAAQPEPAPASSSVPSDSIDRLLSEARTVGAQAVLLTRLGADTTTQGGSRVGVGIGPSLGLGLGGGIGVGLGLGLGMMVPVGGASVEQSWVVESQWLDAKSGRALWVGRAHGPAGGDVSTQSAAVVDAALDGAVKDGLLQAK